jgi:hypothetical protein
MKRIRNLVWMTIALLFGSLAPLRAQTGPEAGGHELQFWTAGGHGTNGVEQHTSVFLAGARFGWILTSPHGPGFLRGQFEYAVDAIPAFVVFQPTNTAYGVGLDPFALIWNFQKHGRIVPYAELSGGALFTNTQVPAGTSRINFISDGGLGVHFLMAKLKWNADIRFMHISSAGLSSINPGINTVQLRLGIGMFTGSRRE